MVYCAYESDNIQVGIPVEPTVNVETSNHESKTYFDYGLYICISWIYAIETLIGQLYAIDNTANPITNDVNSALVTTESDMDMPPSTSNCLANNN